MTPENEMPPRLRKFIGAIALIVLVCVWSLLAMALAQSVLTDINGFVAAIFYVVAGLGWVLPAMPLISWMAKGGRREHSKLAAQPGHKGERILR
jgi:hypothetical protein